jgi:hypothetical protein
MILDIDTNLKNVNRKIKVIWGSPGSKLNIYKVYRTMVSYPTISANNNF